MNKDKPKIFLSYAHEDIGMAKRLYQDLNRYGIDIWFDNESLLGGQNWKFEINKAIKESTYFLAVLSKESIDSIGYVQKELKIALEMLDLRPKNKTYILPVRIENCEPLDERLSELHWIDVFPENEYQNGFKKILQVVSPGTFIIRYEPNELSAAEVNQMLKLHGYYDRYRNPEGNGIDHQYKLHEIKGDIFVFDEATGLMWQQSGSPSPHGEYSKNYSSWLKKLNQKGFAGFKDWRVPTLEEAMSLIEPQRKNAQYIDPVFDIKQEWIWTADQVKGTSHQWIVGFIDGICSDDTLYYDLNHLEFYVRAVRSAKSS